MILVNNIITIELQVQTGDEMTQELEAAWNLYTRGMFLNSYYQMIWVRL